MAGVTLVYHKKNSTVKRNLSKLRIQITPKTVPDSDYTGCSINLLTDIKYLRCKYSTLDKIG